MPGQVELPSVLMFLSKREIDFDEGSLSCVQFAVRAHDLNLTDFHFHVDYWRTDEDGIDTDFAYSGWCRSTKRGIRSISKGIFPVYYDPGPIGRYRIVPTLAGHSLFHPPGCPPNHRERVVAAHLLAYYRKLMPSTSCFHRRLTATFAFDGSIFARKGFVRLMLIAKGCQSSPLYPTDFETSEYLVSWAAEHGLVPPTKPPIHLLTPD